MENSSTSTETKKKQKINTVSFIRYSTLFLIIVILLFSLIILLAGRDTQRIDIEKNPIQYINTGWYYYDDSGNKIIIDSLPVKLSEKDSLSGKYKIYREKTEDLAESKFLSFYSHHAGFKFYSDSELIYEFSNTTFPKKLKTYRAFYHLISCQRIKGKTISIELEPKISSKAEFSEIELGTEFDILYAHFFARYNRLILGFILLIVGFVMLLNCIVFKTLKEDNSLLYLSIILILVGLWQFEESRFIQFMITYQPVHWILEYAVQPLILLSSFLFIREISSTKKERMLVFLFIMDCAAIIIQLILQIAGIMAMTETVIFIHICYIFSTFYVFALINKNYKFKTFAARVVFNINLLMGVFSFLTALLLSNYTKHNVSNFTFIGFGFTFIALAIIIGKRINHQLNKIQKVTHYDSLSYLDSLTGVFNRNKWYQFKETIDKTEKKYPESCLIIFEISNLKQINESFGYSEGDKVLTAYASFVKRAVPEKSPVYRIKGNIFAAFCTEITKEDVRKIILKINRYVINQHDFNFAIASCTGYSFFKPRTTADFFIAQDETTKQIEEQKKLMKI